MITAITALSFIAGVIVALSFVFYFVTEVVDNKGCYIFTGLNGLYVVTDGKMTLQNTIKAVDIAYSKEVLENVDEFVDKILNEETNNKDPKD